MRVISNPERKRRVHTFCHREPRPEPAADEVKDLNICHPEPRPEPVEGRSEGSNHFFSLDLVYFTLIMITIPAILELLCPSNR